MAKKALTRVSTMEESKDICKIGIDLDGTISEYPEFFKLLSRAMARAGCKIYVVTDRMPGTETAVAHELERYDITYHVIKITAQKAKYILREGISILFDDVDEYFLDLPEEVAVFKIRQKYNFDFGRKRWR